jgi:hypothetical protein
VRSVTELREAWLTRAIEAVVDDSRRRSLMEAIALLTSLAEWDTDRAST